MFLVKRSKGSIPNEVSTYSGTSIRYTILYMHLLPETTHIPTHNHTCVYTCACVYTYICISSVTQLCPTLCNSMNRSMPGLPVYHQLPEFTQTHVHWVGDAIHPSHPLSSPSPPALSLSQPGSFQMSHPFSSGGQSIRVSASTSVLPMNTQDWSPLGWTGCISLQSKGLARVFSNTTVQKHQFFGAQPFSQSNSHIH